MAAGAGTQRGPCAPPLLCLQLHPKGFRGTFDYNTNVWASLGSGLLRAGAPVGPPAGVLPWGQDLAAGYLPPNASHGMGMRHCSSIGPHFAALHRCRCAGRCPRLPLASSAGPQPLPAPAMQ
jgi:hypothetical protein